MVTKNIIKQPKAVVEIQVSMPWSDIEPKWNETLQKLAQDVELPGFRKGSAPADMVETQISQNLQQEVLKVVMPQALMEALQGTDVVPIDYPKYQLVSFAKGSELKFNAQVTQRPAVAVTEYKSISVTRPAQKPVTDDEVDKVITDLFNRWKIRQPASPTLGEPPAPATGSKDQATGTQNTPGGSLNFNQAPTAASSPPPAASEAPDDNFAKAVGATDLSDLKAKIRLDLESEAKYNNELDFEEAILQEVEKRTQVEVPEVLVQDELNRMLVSLQRRVTDMGLVFDDYLKSQNKTLDGLKDEWRTQADKNVRMELGLAEIARQESVQITDDELQAEIDKIQDSRTKAQFNAEESRMHLRHALRQTRTLDLLKTLVKSF